MPFRMNQTSLGTSVSGTLVGPDLDRARKLKAVQTTIEASLRTHLPRSNRSLGGQLDKALEYAVFSGGKRLRPLMTLLGTRVASGSTTEALPAACAVEFVHASSLILDDLPCMDDAALRRGKPTLHEVFGEDIALLAAIALLNQAYAIFGRTPELIREATECIGLEGMIGGQSLDLDPEGAGNVSLTDRNRKTSALTRLALTAGAIACNAPRDQVSALARTGQCFGEAYQVYDDVLDRKAQSAQTGKTAGQDKRHNRPSHAAEFDLAECESQVITLLGTAHRSLMVTFGPTEPVEDLMTFFKRIFGSLSSAASDIFDKAKGSNQPQKTPNGTAGI
jgi:geranylgeranyl diphosphate synthase type II